MRRVVDENPFLEPQPPIVPDTGAVRELIAEDVLAALKRSERCYFPICSVRAKNASIAGYVIVLCCVNTPWPTS